jgi:Uma2 family endonuclease
VQIPLLWLVYPNRNEVEVYIKGELHQTLGVDDSLDGGDVLPDFTLAVKNIFA